MNLRQVDIVPREERGDEPGRPVPMPAGAAPYYMPPAMPGPDGALPRSTMPDPAMMMCYQQQARSRTDRVHGAA